MFFHIHIFLSFPFPFFFFFFFFFEKKKVVLKSGETLRTQPWLKIDNSTSSQLRWQRAYHQAKGLWSERVAPSVYFKFVTFLFLLSAKKKKKKSETWITYLKTSGKIELQCTPRPTPGGGWGYSLGGRSSVFWYRAKLFVPRFSLLFFFFRAQVEITLQSKSRKEQPRKIISSLSD